MFFSLFMLTAIKPALNSSLSLHIWHKMADDLKKVKEIIKWLLPCSDISHYQVRSALMRSTRIYNNLKLKGTGNVEEDYVGHSGNGINISCG